MIHYKEYKKPANLLEAYELNKAKSAVIAGGFCFLRLGNRTVKTLVDVSGVLSHEIEEDENFFKIGAMVTLRALEQHEALNRYTDGAVRDSVKRIVGTQFRNLATVGGSIFGRFGFSDLLTCFLAMDTWVELFKGGQVPMEEFVSMKRDEDILTAVIIKKTAIHTAYEALRNEATDFPVLSVAVAEYRDGKTAVSVGARPGAARRVMVDWPAFKIADSGKEIAKQFTYGTNMRASAEYREYLAGVLIERAAKHVADAAKTQEKDVKREGKEKWN